MKVALTSGRARASYLRVHKNKASGRVVGATLASSVFIDPISVQPVEPYHEGINRSGLVNPTLGTIMLNE